MAIILVADDHPLSRHFLATLLSYHGHQIHEAGDGAEALHAAHQQTPDLIITEVAMPHMDGNALVVALRADPDLAHIPVVFYTADDGEAESRAIARAAGVEYLIAKPSDPEVILETVERALGNPASGRPPDSSRRYVERLHDLESQIEQRAGQLRMANEALRREMAEREHIEEELSASRQDLAALFEGSPLPIVGFDLDRRVRAWNRAAERTFGWRADEVIGRPNPLIAPDLAEEFEALAARCIAGATVTDLQVERLRKDGVRITASVSMAPLYDAGGVARGFVSIINDITDRKRSEAELRTSQERLRALSARVLSIQEEERTRIARELHDDLAQLLTAIKIDASRLVHDVSTGATPPGSVLGGIVPLIDTTLDAIGRIISELRPTRIGEMGLAAAVEKKLADFRHRTDIECELSIRPEDLEIREDIAAAVFRILEEALINVARHSGATRAEVRLRLQQDELLLDVRDNGRGIRDAEIHADDAYGVIGMKERAYLFDGTLTITGVEDRGTIVAARIPLGGQSDDKRE